MLKSTGRIKYPTFPSTGPASAIYCDESCLAKPLPEGDRHLANIAQDGSNGLIRVLRTEMAPLDSIDPAWHTHIIDSAYLKDPDQDEHENQSILQTRPVTDRSASIWRRQRSRHSVLAPNSSQQPSVATEVYRWINEYDTVTTKRRSPP